MIPVFKTHKALTAHLLTIKTNSHTVGFVPTMGALHKGHVSLMQTALCETDYLVVSIFVNPTQFNNASDLNKYPRDVTKDVSFMTANLNTTRCCVYAPDVDDVYGNAPIANKYAYNGLENTMEGANRPGHFDGVGTILEFLFKVVTPDKAFFGEKDFQQLQIVKSLVRQLQLPITIIGCPILRENNNLAMSSRNERLSASARKEAAFIYQSLELAVNYFKKNSMLATQQMIVKLYENHPTLTLEYFIIASEKTLKPALRKSSKNNYRAFIVVHIENVRLIDNLKVS